MEGISLLLLQNKAYSHGFAKTAIKIQRKCSPLIMFSTKKVHTKAIFVFSFLKIDIFYRKHSERIEEIPRISNFPPNSMAKFCQVQEESSTPPNTK